MSELQLLLLVAFIALAAGTAIGALLFSGRSAPASKPSEIPKETLRVDLLRVWRDPVRLRLVVGLKGEQASAPAELSPGALDSLRSTLEELNYWSGIHQAHEQTPEPLPVPLTPLTSDGKPARIGPADVISRAIRADARKPEPSLPSIAAQIDEILQEKLAADQSIKRAIRLMEIPGKGMVVMVGLDQFAGVDEVPDADVRALIRESVEEWERRVES